MRCSPHGGLSPAGSPGLDLHPIEHAAGHPSRLLVALATLPALGPYLLLGYVLRLEPPALGARLRPSARSVAVDLRPWDPILEAAPWEDLGTALRGTGPGESVGAPTVAIPAPLPRASALPDLPGQPPAGLADGPNPSSLPEGLPAQTPGGGDSALAAPQGSQGSGSDSGQGSGRGGRAGGPGDASGARGIEEDVVPIRSVRAQWGQGTTTGVVKVVILIDAEGRVISAKAVSGPPEFWSQSETAARQWQFSVPPGLRSQCPLRRSIIFRPV